MLSEKEKMEKITSEEILAIIQTIGSNYAMLFNNGRMEYSQFVVLDCFLAKIESETNKLILKKIAEEKK